MIGGFSDRPNRTIALDLLGATRRRQVLEQTRLMLKANGVLPARARIVGPLTADSESPIRKQLESAWGTRCLNLTVDSEGGLTRVAEAISKDLEQLKDHGDVHIRAHCPGQCLSAAAMPFLQAAERSCSRSANFLLHRMTVDYSAASRLTALELHSLADALNESDELELGLLKARGVWLPPSWAGKYRRGDDLVLNANMAKGIGLVGWVTDA